MSSQTLNLSLPLAVASPRRLLGQSDFAYLGYWRMPGTLGASTSDYSLGLAMRYVAGQRRFLSLGYSGAGGNPAYRVVEYIPNNPSPPSLESTSVTVTNTWAGHDLWGATGYDGSGARVGLYVDPAAPNDLWYTSVGDYPQGSYSANAVNSLSVRTLNPDGSCSGFGGFWGLQGVGARANYGGLRRVPSWFAAANGVGPYLTGFGGYSSLYAQGLGASLGPLWYFTPDPRTFPQNASYFDVTPTIPASAFKTGADCRSGSTITDWQAQGYAARTQDRGVRVTSVLNYFDSGAYTAAGGQTVAPTRWLSPMPGDPDGLGRWAWIESYNGAFNWIDNDAGSRSAHGIVCVLSAGTGHEWYEASNRHSDGKTVEIHVYDPADVAAVLAGTLAPYKLRPRSAWEVILPQLGIGSVDGAAFDPTTSTLFLYAPSYSNKARLHAFAVGGA